MGWGTTSLVCLEALTPRATMSEAWVGATRLREIRNSYWKQGDEPRQGVELKKMGEEVLPEEAGQGLGGARGRDWRWDRGCWGFY